MRIVNCDSCNAFCAVNTKSRRCLACSWRHYAMAAKAHAVVARMVRKGLLPNLKAEHVPCADCGARADRYDHRDYHKPKDVTPVCRACNHKRGHAISIGATP